MTTTQGDNAVSGLVFNVQKYSVHDGPGIRTIVFFKGCPMSCHWCSNPESQSFKAELAFNEGRCLGLTKCVRCLKACPHDAISAKEDKPVFNRSICTTCHRPCVAACPAAGVIAYGKQMRVDEVLRIVEQDGVFYNRSGGGITLSGGEPTAQPEFALALLRQARQHRIRTAMETCGYAPWEVLREVCALLDSLLFDIKSLDSGRHKQCTGVPNELILANFKRIVETFPALPIRARTPIIPGFNDTEQAVLAIAEFVAVFPNLDFEILPYHRLGTQKYVFLDLEAPMGEASLADKTFRQLEAIAKSTSALPGKTSVEAHPANEYLRAAKRTEMTRPSVVGRQ